MFTVIIINIILLLLFHHFTPLFFNTLVVQTFLFNIMHCTCYAKITNGSSHHPETEKIELKLFRTCYCFHFESNWCKIITFVFKTDWNAVSISSYLAQLFLLFGSLKKNTREEMLKAWKKNTALFLFLEIDDGTLQKIVHVCNEIFPLLF